jgi:2-polyprenyl-3-methyl-5-hydroxy-6-metoxy-1,4-benzoquinol methylase
VARYRKPDGPWAIDFSYRLAGPLQGKRVLDVGAGTGENALVLAALGARVTAVDISSKSLEVLRQRAEISGLAARIETFCSPIEAYSTDEVFDVVWAEAFLHHVIPNLDLVLNSLETRIAPGGRILFSEPLAPRWLRRIRLLLPIQAHGTPGERPLEPMEIAIIQAHFPGMRKRSFYCLSRLLQ